MPKPKARGRPRRVRMTAPELDALPETRDAPIERQVYKIIRRSLMAGAMEPGSRISGRSLAEALGVSPMPVREALKRLESDGAVESYAKSGYRVADLTASEFKEMFALRVRIEGLMVREAARLIEPKVLERAAGFHRKIMSATDSRKMLQYNFRMHFCIYESAQMPYALSMVENMWLRMGPTFNRLVGQYTIDAAYSNHDQILRALRDREPDAAERALIRDLVEAADIIERLLAAPAR